MLIQQRNTCMNEYLRFFAVWRGPNWFHFSFHLNKLIVLHFCEQRKKVLLLRLNFLPLTQKKKQQESRKKKNKTKLQSSCVFLGSGWYHVLFPFFLFLPQDDWKRLKLNVMLNVVKKIFQYLLFIVSFSLMKRSKPFFRVTREDD